jgi:hypothetical protein
VMLPHSWSPMARIAGRGIAAEPSRFTTRPTPTGGIRSPKQRRSRFSYQLARIPTLSIAPVSRRASSRAHTVAGGRTSADRLVERMRRGRTRRAQRRCTSLSRPPVEEGAARRTRANNRPNREATVGTRRQGNRRGRAGQIRPSGRDQRMDSSLAHGRRALADARYLAGALGSPFVIVNTPV